MVPFLRSSRRSAWLRACAGSWRMASRLRPRVLSSARVANRRYWWRMSRWLVGSSRSSHLPLRSASGAGRSWARTRARWTRCCSPPESCRQLRCARGVRSKVSMASAQTALSCFCAGVPRHASRPMRMRSATGLGKARAGCWPRTARLAASARGCSRLSGVPRWVMCASWRLPPARAFSRVLLPAPLGPMMAVNCPSGSCQWSRLRRVCWPWRMWRWCAASRASDMACSAFPYEDAEEGRADEGGEDADGEFGGGDDGAGDGVGEQ